MQTILWTISISIERTMWLYIASALLLTKHILGFLLSVPDAWFLTCFAWSSLRLSLCHFLLFLWFLCYFLLLFLFCFVFILYSHAFCRCSHTLTDFIPRNKVNFKATNFIVPIVASRVLTRHQLYRSLMTLINRKRILCIIALVKQLFWKAIQRSI